MKLDTREIYCPAHFGNSYECLAREEMRDYLAEAVHWGFTRYGDWFDTIDLSDPYDEPRHYQLAHALWDRKRAAFQSAQALGLETTLLLTPNHVFIDQVTAANKAERTKPSVFGQLVCPSRPGVREMILNNYRNLFRDLAEHGVNLTTFAACPYDYGGCTCDDCAPWILTFASLVKGILPIAREFHPDIELHLVGWWWEREEHELFAAWADRELPGEVESIALHILYGERGPADVPLPQGCARRAFIHNGYADVGEPKDVYGTWGPIAAPLRLSETLQGLSETRALGFMAYSEGIYEDVNRAVLGALSSGYASSAAEALAEYARRYFGADEATAQEWADWFAAWGDPFEVDVTPLRKTFDRLAPRATPSWRLDQWRCKLRMFELRRAIGEGEEWPESRREQSAEFVRTVEHLHRRVWGLGPTRHIFGGPFMANECPQLGPPYPPLPPDYPRVRRPATTVTEPATDRQWPREV